MSVYRTILIGGLLTVTIAAAPACAAANTLLSGYGGPGQGNQAILGSALLNRPGGGGSSGGGGGSATRASAPGESASGAPASAAPSTSAARSTSQRKASGASKGARGGGKQAPRASANGGAHGGERQGNGGSGRTTTASFYPTSEHIPAGQGSDALGLSGSEILYIILALAVLGFTAVLMRGLTRADSAGRRG